MLTSIRIISIVTAIVVTIIYPVMLYLETYIECYGRSAFCGEGWVARTVVTGAYLAIVAFIVGLTRWGLRAADRRDTIQAGDTL